MAYQQTGPTFALCGTFSGTSIPASRWLIKFNHEMKGYRDQEGVIPPDTYLESLNMLLTDDAAEWAESHPDAIRLLAEPNPTAATVESFKTLFCERFPTKTVEVTPLSFDVELAELHQRTDESLSAYYKRVTGLMSRIGAKDRPPSTPSATPFTALESAMLDTILRAFIRGLNDQSIRQEATRGMASADRSLRNVYSLAEEARRTNLEVQKLREEDAKSNELRFYKSLVERNYPEQQVASLRASFQQKDQPQRQWSFHQEPSQRPPGPAFPPPSQPEDRPRPIYHSGPHAQAPPSVLAPNPSKGNVGRGGYSNVGPGNRFRNQPFQPTPKNLPNRSESNNPWINGSKVYAYDKDGRLCIRCGHLGHISKECQDDVLPAWEQSYLKELVFGSSAQVNFASASFGEFDGNVHPYGSRCSSTPPQFTPQASSSATSQMSGALLSPQSNSILYGVAGLSLTPADSHAVDTNLGESSGPNKRARVEDENIPPIQEANSVPRPQPYRQPAQQQPQVPPQANVNQPPFQAMPAPAQQSFPQPMPASQMPQPSVQIPAVDDRPKRKGQKRVGKKIEPQPLVGMFNDLIGKYDSPVSIRSVLQDNKVDMSWMDLLAWSPSVCRELKRLCTRVPKKRIPKPKPDQSYQIPFAQSNPNFQQQQFAQPFQPAPQQMPYQPQVPQVPFQQYSQPFAGTSSSITYDTERHTRFLSALVHLDKAFRILTEVLKADGSTCTLERKYTQADQGSDMNVISAGLVRFLGLTLLALADVGFKGLSMRTADHREAVLQHYVVLRLSVEGIVRDIKCFVAPELPHTTASGQTEYLSLILGLPWLYSVDARISIRQSTIMIGDATIGEKVRSVVGPELVFCKDHNLLMYPKSALAVPGRIVEEIEDASDSESSSSEEEDDLSDIEDDVPKKDFH